MLHVEITLVSTQISLGFMTCATTLIVRTNGVSGREDESMGGREGEKQRGRKGERVRGWSGDRVRVCKGQGGVGSEFVARQQRALGGCGVVRVSA